MNAQTSFTVGIQVRSLKNRGKGEIVTIEPETGEIRVRFTGSEWFNPHMCVFRRDEIDSEIEVINEGFRRAEIGG